ncbi:MULTISPECIES: hypothetical protein [unclassified Sulfitobacter]|jgi:hypothetical protein|uniref:hypothetical protein n=1 Tax=unclassified Sulfitobacter TaxID=196795 RepID=UPI0007C209A9|nr:MULTISPECIES: hypothetical protein [unclassified Sulfitobacter]KZX97744.1 hypothetical protein A3720_17645 [Sulfitobacter sp. HI0021]KZY04581.1 hypothetical protein A3722_18810 [Sulfitobacter sp. HI0027]KZZ01846.1 hypothetical protein A3747_17825 [Sulfitobacter sp. HI0076]
MPKIDPDPIEEFDCKDQNGKPVIVSKHAILSESSALIGDKVRTSSASHTFRMNGREVIQIDEQTFKVPQTDQLLKIQP